MNENKKLKMDDNYYKCLRHLQEIDFVLLELSLYLDTHPNDQNALAQLNQYHQIRQRVYREYESCYGPLYQFGRSSSKYPWEWIETPWPWQV
ncbi:spore coat protein CotJB [Chengkuizengella sp. 2205SS18-9]|uniref:Spore coat protein CotJB n=1 Tax=Chengkuizengella axinellae TaxID=3064388 RepID=A0ABT9J0C5_9BACL|nr:spore coat protein CotJB [Chengkuizengella sp. 2205SS18-9]MDP5275074.1 spore coat protein CotJB [Chengkuizengella sp. 2205SS18-9]